MRDCDDVDVVLANPVDDYVRESTNGELPGGADPR
jgi:hypothetical protein